MTTQIGSEYSKIKRDWRGLYLVWGYPRGSHRAELMALTLGMPIRYIYFGRSKGLLTSLFRYPLQMIKTPFVLKQYAPDITFVQSPPIFGPLTVYLWNLFAPRRGFIIDAHSSSLLSQVWQWTMPLHRFLSRQAISTLLPNEGLQEVVASWDIHAFTLEGAPTVYPDREKVVLEPGTPHILFVTNASRDEPIREFLLAADRMPQVKFFVTGDYKYSEFGDDLLADVPQNVTFTGYLSDPEYYGLMEAVEAVLCLTKRAKTFQSGASEALWLGKPIITSGWPVLKDYFSAGTEFVDNSPESIVEAVNKVLANLQSYQEGVATLQAKRREEWWQRVDALYNHIALERKSRMGVQS